MKFVPIRLNIIKGIAFDSSSVNPVKFLKLQEVVDDTA